MADLTTNYLGLTLKNPIIVGASNLVSNRDNLKRMEDAGAAAIVYKTLFEEQIQLERLEMDEDLHAYQDRNAEMISLFPDIEHAGPSEHLMNLRLAKETVKIPVIASLNCVAIETWLEYAKQIEETGTDALELNFYAIPTDSKKEEVDIIEHQLQVLKTVKESVKIPVSVKLSPYYTNILNVIKQMEMAGANGFVLFNRFLQPDIDITTETHLNHFAASSSEESLLPIKFAGLLYGNTRASICANSGIYSGGDIVKTILSGADCVQVVSCLYKHKISHLNILSQQLTDWMDSKNYKSISDFKGKLSQKNIKDPYIYKRAQYIDILLKSGDVFKQHALV